MMAESLCLCIMMFFVLFNEYLLSWDRAKSGFYHQAFWVQILAVFLITYVSVGKYFICVLV